MMIFRSIVFSSFASENWQLFYFYLILAVSTDNNLLKIWLLFRSIFGYVRYDSVFPSGVHYLTETISDVYLIIFLYHQNYWSYIVIMIFLLTPIINFGGITYVIYFLLNNTNDILWRQSILSPTSAAVYGYWLLIRIMSMMTLMKISVHATMASIAYNCLIFTKMDYNISFYVEMITMGIVADELSSLLHYECSLSH